MFSLSPTKISRNNFVFSLTNNDKFEFNPDAMHMQIFCDPNEGPNFGNDFLAIYREMPQKFKNPPRPGNLFG